MRRGPEELYTIKPDGTDLQAMPNTAPYGFSDDSPDWSPTGEKITFRSWSWDFFTGSLFIANADGTEAVLFDGCNGSTETDCVSSFAADQTGHPTEVRSFFT